MDGFVAWLKQLQFDGVWQTAVLVAASLLCITFHETCHGLVAYWLGDPTAKRAGRLTLNPLRHIDIGGLLMMALFRFGWAKPVPVDMRYFKHPKRDMALTAAAGPLSNVLLAYLAVLLYGVFAYWYYFSGSTAVYVFALFFYYVEIISAGLAVFNLFPIPPLDGSRALYLIAALLFGPAVGDAAAAVTGLACALALVGTGIYIAAETGGGALFLLAALALLFGTLPQLRLAKRMRKV